MDARIAMSLQQEENAMCAAPIHRRASRVERSSQFVAASSLVRNNVVSRFAYTIVYNVPLCFVRRTAVVSTDTFGTVTTFFIITFCLG